MKSNSRICLVFCLCLLIASAGCTSKNPTAAAVSGPTVDTYQLVNITSTKATVNSNIYGAGSSSTVEMTSWSTPITVCNNPTTFQMVNSGYFVYNPDALNLELVPNARINTGAPPAPPENYVYSGPCTNVAVTGYNVSYVPTGLTDGYDQYGISVNGEINDPECSLYPPGAGNLDNVELEVFPLSFSSTKNYDVSPYQGIEFYVFIALNDSAVDRVFNAYVQDQVPSGTGSGNCINTTSPPPNDPNPWDTHCYDGFEYDYTNTPKNQWVLIQKYWGDLKQYGYGSISNPPTFSGTQLQSLSFFAWTEENAYQSGLITINYTISGIRFF